MDGNRLTIAIKEAKRFVSVAESALGKIKEDSLVQYNGCKETGAARRASMDLTRVLAELRK